MFWVLFILKAQTIINEVQNCYKILKFHQTIAHTLLLTCKMHGIDLTITRVTV